MKKIYMLLMCLMIAGGLYAANEITANLTLKVEKGVLSVTKTSSKQFNINHSNPNVAGVTLNVLTTATGTLIPLGNVASNGVAWFGNLGTNNIEIGVRDSATNFLPIITLKSNESWCCRINLGCVPYARATNATTVLEYEIFDD